jgi:hypothetical protein
MSMGVELCEFERDDFTHRILTALFCKDNYTDVID